MTRGQGTLANGVSGEFKKTDQLIPEEGKGDLREASKRWKVDGEEASNREVRSRNPNNSSKTEYSRLVFCLWRMEERMQVPLWGPRWD